MHRKAIARAAAAHQVLLRAVDESAAVYGANTGFGRLALERIPAEDLRTLQLNLVRSHAAGVGEPLPDCVVRLTMLLKLNSLLAGYSGRGATTSGPACPDASTKICCRWFLPRAR